MSDTKQIIFSMLTENTGTHMLDSGGDNGRHWQRNQDLTVETLDKAEAATFDSFELKYGRISVTANLYHFLADRLTFDEEKTADLEAFGKSEDHANEPWLASMEAWLDARRDAGIEITGLYGEGEPITVNTYNHENHLSQTIQFIYWTENHEAFVALQIHGGADVRGGYTAPKVFAAEDQILFFADAHVACDKCDAHWQTDDTVHWYRDGACGVGAGTQLEDYVAHVLDGENEDADTDGLLVFDPERGEVRCPCCENGKLRPSI